jgi:hypothetical protein
MADTLAPTFPLYPLSVGQPIGVPASAAVEVVVVAATATEAACRAMTCMNPSISETLLMNCLGEGEPRSTEFFGALYFA